MGRANGETDIFPSSRTFQDYKSKVASTRNLTFDIVRCWLRSTNGYNRCLNSRHLRNRIRLLLFDVTRRKILQLGRFDKIRNNLRVLMEQWLCAREVGFIVRFCTAAKRGNDLAWKTWNVIPAFNYLRSGNVKNWQTSRRGFRKFQIQRGPWTKEREIIF